MKKYFPSKRDVWITLVLWGAAIGLTYACVDVAGSPRPFVFRVLFGLVCVAAAILPLWILYGTSYVIRNGELSIRCGPFRHRVPVSAIDEVVPSRSPVSSPACSLDRLHIKYRGSRQGMLISPADKDAFLRELVDLDAQLSVQGDGVVRTG